MTIKEALKPEQIEALGVIGKYDPVVADEVERNIDSLLDCTVHKCTLPDVYCPHCEDGNTCSVRLKR
ncbi:MAG TPA: hypothetical protein ENG95_05895 [Nitrospirae bacterium]|nr:hypothetical protein [Nitrospirota bacterium]